MTVQIVKDGETVSQSRNLRGVLTYARKAGVDSAVVLKTTEGAFLYLQFADGAECRTNFASFNVCLGFVRARRSWGLNAVRCADDHWRFYFPYASTNRAA